MPIPAVVARFNRKVTNPLLRHLVGVGPFAELEHVGRRSGLVRHTVVWAFRSGTSLSIALTYGPDVDWLKNLEAAGGGRIRIRGRVLDVGPPKRLSPTEGLRRMPWMVRAVLPLIDVGDFIELPVLPDHAAP